MFPTVMDGVGQIMGRHTFHLSMTKFRTALSGLAVTAFVILSSTQFAKSETSCATRAAEYIEKLEALFARELNSSTPFRALNKAYFPLTSCDVTEHSQIIGRSRYIKTIGSQPDSWTVFVLRHGMIEVGFGYSSKKQSTELDYAKVAK